MKTILFDVDGVLADFVLGFTTLAAHYGSYRQPWGTAEHHEGRWDFKDVFSQELIDRCWEHINTSINWWRTLPRLVNGNTLMHINALQREHQVVFATNRGMSRRAQQQTQEWLEESGVYHPNVVLTRHKGDIARAIGADFSIEDKPENAACVHWIADQKPCHSYLLVWPSTRAKAEYLPENIRRVYSVGEFLDEVRTHEND